MNKMKILKGKGYDMNLHNKTKRDAISAFWRSVQEN